MVIRLKSSQSRKKLNYEDIHLMPCRIHAEGQHKITEYFRPYLLHSKCDDLKASFRGYPLHGKMLRIPERYVGVVAQVGKCPDPDTKNLYVTSTFDSLTFWNWDKPPSKNDPFLKAMDWIEIAEVLHASEVESKVERT